MFFLSISLSFFFSFLLPRPSSKPTCKVNKHSHQRIEEEDSSISHFQKHKQSKQNKWKTILTLRTQIPAIPHRALGRLNSRTHRRGMISNHLPTTKPNSCAAMAAKYNHVPMTTSSLTSAVRQRSSPLTATSSFPP